MAISLKVVKENLTYVDDKKASHGNVDFGALNGDSIVGIRILSRMIFMQRSFLNYSISINISEFK